MISFERWFQQPDRELPELTKLEAAYSLTSLAMLLDEQITSNERKVQIDFLKAHGINRRDHMDLDERIRQMHRLGGGRLLFHAAESTLADPIDRYRGLGLIIRVLHASDEPSSQEEGFLQALYSRWAIPADQIEVLETSVDQLPRTWFNVLFHFIGTQSKTDPQLLDAVLTAIAERDHRLAREASESKFKPETEAQKLVEKRPTTILSSVRNALQAGQLPLPTVEHIRELMKPFYSEAQAHSIAQCVCQFLALHRLKVA